MKYEKDLEIKVKCDILVIGGSQSGVSAAVSAKRTFPDMNVHLIEQFGNLGGQSTNCMVCHYEFREYTNNKGQIIAKGLGKEIIKRVVDRGNSDPLYSEWLNENGPPFKNVVDQRGYGDMPLDVEDLKLTFQEMCDEVGIQVHLFTKLIDVKTSSDKSEYIAPDIVIVSDFYDLYAIKAKIIIDCSSNNDVAWKINGLESVYIPKKQVMPMQTYAWFGGVDIKKFIDDLWDKRDWWQIVYPNDKEQMLDHMKEGKSMVIRGGASYIDQVDDKWDGILDELEEYCIPMIYYMFKPIKIIPIKIGSKIKYIGTFAIEGPASFKIQSDSDNVSDFMQKQIKAVHLLRKIHSILPGWKNCFVERTASNMGFRQTRIIKGLYELTSDDVKKGNHQIDAIGRSAGHDISRFQTEYEFGYDIPYRAIVPKKIDGLLIGARSISCSPTEDALIALNSHRGISATIIVSQGAGTAAALCIKNNIQPRDVNIKELQDELKKQDVVLKAPHR